MGILIKNLRLPREYEQVNITILSDGSIIEHFKNESGRWSSYRSGGLKAIELPSQGRLVSAEDFIDSFEDIINECRRQLSEKGKDITVLNYFHDTIVELMGYMPTVLEATE